MNLKRNRQLDSEVFIGSVADVSFLLIIFFMITSAFAVTKGMDFTLPPEVEGPVEAWESVDVHVLHDGTLEVDGKTMKLAQLLPYIEARLVQNAEKPVILRGDRNTPYGSMIRVLDELRQSEEKLGFEIENLAIPTFREQQIFLSPFDI
jgi:biopolymer transport protein TolR